MPQMSRTEGLLPAEHPEGVCRLRAEVDGVIDGYRIPADCASRLQGRR